MDKIGQNKTNLDRLGQVKTLFYNAMSKIKLVYEIFRSTLKFVKLFSICLTASN